MPANLVISGSSNPSGPINAGSSITYTMTVLNNGPDVATNVILTDTLPNILTTPVYSINGSTPWVTWTGSLPLGIVATGSSVSIRLSALVNPSTPAGKGSLVNTAIVSSATSTSAIYTSTNDITVSADLSVLKSTMQKVAAPGGIGSFSIAWQNGGPSNASNVILTDTFPGALLNPQYSINGGQTWASWTGSLNYGTVPVSTSNQLTIQGTVASGARGILSNTASIASSTPDANLANNTSTASIPIVYADLEITKEVFPNPGTAGTTETYTLVIANNGPNATTNVIVTDAIPSIIPNPQYSLDGGNTFLPWTGSLNLGTMQPNTSLDFNISGVIAANTPAGVGLLKNTATISSDLPDPDLSNNTTTTTADVNVSADLSITKLPLSPNAAPGGLASFSIAWNSKGPSNANNVILTDTVSSSLLNPQYSRDGITWLPWTGSLNLGTFTPNTSGSMRLRGTVAPGTTGSISNTSTISSDTPDPNLSDNTSSAAVPIIYSSDLSITKQAIPSPLVAGQTVQYTLVVSNAGPTNATNVILTDTITSTILNPQYSLNNGGTWNPWLGNINLATIPKSNSTKVLISGAVSTTATSTLSNTAKVVSDVPDPNPNNNSVTIHTPVTTSADLSVTNVVAPSVALPTGTLTYTIMVANAGPSSATGVTLADTLPSTLLNPQYSLDNGTSWTAWTGSLNLGALDNGASQTILITSTVAASAVGSLSNTVTVSSSTSDPNLSNNTATATATITASADLSVLKTTSPTPVVAGQTVTFSLLIANAGPSSASGITLTDTLPNTLSNSQYSLDNGSTWAFWTGTLPLNTLASGGSQTVLIQSTLSSTATGSLTNTANVSSTTSDPNLNNNTFTSTTVIYASADLSLVKTASSSGLAPGSTLTYSLLITNAGPSQAIDINLTDAIPSTLLNPEYSLDSGSTWSPWMGSLNFSTLASGASETILITSNISPHASGSITNIASISSTTPDPNLDNNTSTISVMVNYANLISAGNFVKFVDSTLAVIGDILTYTLTIQNTGNVAANSVIITDPIPSGTTYVADSITANVPFTGDPTTTINLTNPIIPTTPITFVTITFKVLINDIPLPSILSNQAQIAYTYTADPTHPNGTSAQGSSNLISTRVISVEEKHREQAITDLIESIVLEESALSHILNAEGEKIQVIVSIKNITPEELLMVNKSVQSMLKTVAQLEIVLHTKLETVTCNLCNFPI